MPPVILLGLGFTTRRLARRFLCRGPHVYAAVRNPERFRDLSAIGLRMADFPRNAILIHTIPPLPEAENSALREVIRGFHARRIIYISSTGVYGARTFADHTTPPAPADEKGRRRIEEEDWLRRGDWETLSIRAAAIYGPGRGVHVRVREGRLPRAEPGGITSRIHADDLATILEAGALTAVAGAYPAADDYPCPTAEVADWCGRLFRKQLPPPWREAEQTAGRKVNGDKIRKLLGVNLSYPDYQAGILASVAEEAAIRQRAPTAAPC